MKYKTTKRAVTNGYCYRIRTGYCCLEALLDPFSASAYTCGADGWNADIYDVRSITPAPDAAIVTGYRPFGNVTPSRSIVEKYEARANVLYSAFHSNPAATYEGYRTDMARLLAQFVDECIAEFKGVE